MPPAHHRWIRSPKLGFLLFGLVQGLAIVGTDALDGIAWPWGVVDLEASASTISRPIERGLTLALCLSPWFALLAWAPGRRRRTGAVASGLLIVTAGLVIHAMASFGGRASDVIGAATTVSVLLHIAALGLCLTPPGPAAWFPGEASKSQLRAGLTLALGWLFAAVVLLTLWLWGGLFELIGIGFFSELFGQKEVIIPVGMATTALGVAIVRDREGLADMLAGLFVVGARYLGVVVAAAIILFVTTLPYTGLEALWATNQATMLLVVVTLAMLVAAFLNAKSGGEGEGFPKPLLWVYAVALILLPVLAGLANYAVWLRVDQYGLTPERVLATVLA